MVTNGSCNGYIQCHSYEEGYSIGYYSTNDTQGIVVESESITEDLSIVADNVQVSGVVTSVMQDEEASLSGSTIMLYPESGRDASPISLAGVYENGELTWSTTVEPGNWVVVVESTVADENTGGVAIGYLEAGIEDGGELEMVMNSGGYLQLDTTWQDIQLDDHHAGSGGTGDYMIDYTCRSYKYDDIGLDVTWNYSLCDSNDGIEFCFQCLVEFQVSLNSLQFSMREC